MIQSQITNQEPGKKKKKKKKGILSVTFDESSIMHVLAYFVD